MNRMNLFGMGEGELRDEIAASMGLPRFRARQILEWMYRRGAESFDGMTSLSKELRAALSERYEIFGARVIERLDSADGLTAKFLLGFSDGTAVETVLMRQPYGTSICVSSQAGCAMGCAFCASTLKGLSRDLTSGEMLAQAVAVNRELAAESRKVDHLVVMGSGEPLANYDNVIGFLRLAHEKYALGMSFRSMTVSTCGIVPGIDRLMEEGIPVTLSISLHAPTDELRSRLMPINRKHSLQGVVEAGRRYGERTGRRVTYEYTLIDGVNDSAEHARELSRLLAGQLASVNLIPVNPVPERGLMRPSPERVRRFEDILRRHGRAVTVRREMGADIGAACGQLRNRYSY